jgi:hypothetical protein
VVRKGGYGRETSGEPKEEGREFLSFNSFFMLLGRYFLLCIA